MEVYKRIVNNRLPGAGGGTSYYGDTVRTTAAKLIELLGEPNGNRYEKTTYEWLLETDNETPFDVYDWKIEHEIALDEEVDFHIAARSGAESSFVTNILRKKLT